MESNNKKTTDGSVSRREFVGVVLAGGATSSAVLSAEAQAGQDKISLAKCTLTINNESQEFDIDPRVTLLDLLREHLHLTGTKKGCDHGQCGACTVLVNDRRINSCLTLAVMHNGDRITTIEGLAANGRLHPMQAAFIEQANGEIPPSESTARRLVPSPERLRPMPQAQHTCR